jgi:nicotinate-nucleotide adenylyltransferase
LGGERIGVFGGTFDPPHVGHLIAASDACEHLRLDRLLLIPSAVPPHKRDRMHAPAELRLKMVRAAAAGDPRFEVLDLELRRDGPSFMVDTLRELAAGRPGSELYLLLGVDAARDLPTWRSPEAVLRLARLAVVTRAGEPIPRPLGTEPVAVPVTRVDVSATEIRRRVAAGGSIRYLVAEAVEGIIRREGLYQNGERA